MNIKEILEKGSRIPQYQQQDELAEFLPIIQELKPRSVVEIGSFYGGTLAMLAMCASEDAIIVGVDCLVHFERNLIEDCLLPHQTLHEIHSDSAGAVEQVRKALEGRPIDILLIDASHSYHDVWRDYTLFKPMVAESGLIVLHDICVKLRTGQNCFYGTDILFNQIGAVSQTYQIVHDEGYIGDDFEAAGFGYFYNQSTISNLEYLIHFLWLGPEPFRLTEFVAVASASLVYPVRPVIWVDPWVPRTGYFDRIQEIAEVIVLDPEMYRRAFKFAFPHRIDCLRYDLLYEYGGLAMDMDTITLHSIHEITSGCDVLVGWESSLHVNGAVTYVREPLNPDIASIMSLARERAQDCPLSDHGAVGPVLLTEFLSKAITNWKVTDKHHFYRYNFVEGGIFEDGDLDDTMYCIHWWNAAYPGKREMIDEVYLLTSSSLYARAARAVGVHHLL